MELLADLADEELRRNGQRGRRKFDATGVLHLDERGCGWRTGSRAVKLRLAGLNGEVASGSHRAGLGHYGAYQVLVRISDHPSDAVHPGKLLGSALGVTAGHKD